MRPSAMEEGRWGGALVIVGAAAFAFASATHILSTHAAQVVSNHLMTLFPVTAGILSVFVARRRVRRERTAWVLLASWGLLSGAGNAIWEYYEFALHRSVPFPSLADAGYLSGNICAIAAIAAFAIVPQRATRWRTVLDGVVIAGSVFVVSWAVLLNDLYATPGRFLEKAVGLAYPVIDVIIVSLIVYIGSRATSHARGQLTIIGLGLMGWAFSDSSFAYLTLRNTYRSGHPVDAGWIGGDALIVLAAILALCVSRTEESGRELAPRTVRIHLPYVAAGLALLIGGASELRGKFDPVVLPGLIVLLVLVVVRQFLAILESKQVTIDRLRSIDEMKSGILNAVSHELRTPLTYIKGAAYVLQDPELPAAVKQDLVGDLVKSTDRLEETLTGLLDFGRLERGVLEPSRRPTEMASLLLGVAEELKTSSHSIRVASQPLVASVDPAQVERIVENLFTNAVRHTPPGTDVEADVSRTPDGVLITVSDDGPGVPGDVREAIFQPFVQSEHTASFGRGTGIGLSVVAKFAELHGGRAWVEDVPGGGARFCVLLGELAA